MTRYTLSKGDRLASTRHIESLFREGTSLAKFPVRIVWRLHVPAEGEVEAPVRVMFSVSKKKFARAVDRNRIKRLMREAYRHMKPGLFDRLAGCGHFHLSIIYTGTEMPGPDTVRKAMHVVVERWLQQLPETPAE
jgi:ribonuclease P protein component